MHNELKEQFNIKHFNTETVLWKIVLKILFIHVSAKSAQRRTRKIYRISECRGRSRTSLRKKIQTFIVGKHPDVKSFRNFVSLDTRSREIRHQDIKVERNANIVIRKYLSSGGVEYFISFEDQFGYLYGFTRLLLPTDTVDVK